MANSVAKEGGTELCRRPPWSNDYIERRSEAVTYRLFHDVFSELVPLHHLISVDIDFIEELDQVMHHALAIGVDLRGTCRVDATPRERQRQRE